MQVNKTNLDFLFQQWDQRYQAAFGKQVTYNQLYSTMMPSDSERTVHSWLEQQEGLKEWTGQREIDNVVARDYTLANKKFQKTLSLGIDKVKDDTYGVFGTAVDGLGQQVALWPDDVMTRVVERGHLDLCWDNQFFFDTDHPVDLDDPSKGTYSNKLVGSQYSLAVDPIAAWDNACIALGEIVGSDGRTHGVVPNVLMVPIRLKKAALTVAGANVVPVTIKNVAGDQNVAAAGVSNVFQGQITVIVNTRLTDPNVAYAMKTDGPINPFIWQLREQPGLVAKNSPTDDNAFFDQELLYGVVGRGNGGYSFPWLAARLSAS